MPGYLFAIYLLSLGFIEPDDNRSGKYPAYIHGRRLRPMILRPISLELIRL